jgi:hypothetical protein
LCSLERCFVYYLKIQATESSDISQKRVHMKTVTNILSFFITIFRSFSTLTFKFQVFFKKHTVVRDGLPHNLNCEHPDSSLFFSPNSRSSHSEPHISFLC